MRVNSITSIIRQKQTFLDKIDKFVSWKVIAKFIKHSIDTNCNAIGRPAYPTLKMFRVMLLQFWYNLSDREISYALFDRVSFRKFAGFSFDIETPSYSTICRFRNRFFAVGLDVILFNLVNKYLNMIGVITRDGIIVDSTIVKSSRKPRKTINIKDKKHAIFYSEDKDAKWTVKANKPYYGYKLHLATDLNHGFIVVGKVTSANRSDTKEIIPLLEKISLEKGAIILADKGYCSTKNRESIANLGYVPGIMYRSKRSKLLSKLEQKINSVISPVRSAVERTFGTLKRGYGFYRTKYLGIAKTRGQFFFSALAFNLKKAANFIIDY